MTELKYYCDRCKVEMHSTDKGCRLDIDGLKITALLCDDCKDKLIAQIEIHTDNVSSKKGI